MPVTMNREAEEVSYIRGEESPICEERTSMSSADDVIEMKSLCGEIADWIVGKFAPVKARITVVMSEVSIGENRALELLRGKALRVDGWEKDNARRSVAKLRAEARRREADATVANLNRAVAYLRSTDPDGYRHDIDAMEHTLSRAGLLGRALAETTD